MKENHGMPNAAKPAQNGALGTQTDSEALLQALEPVLRELFGMEPQQLCEKSAQELMLLARRHSAASSPQQREAAVQEGYARLKQEFARVQALYPQAELSQELENPAFVRLLRHGIDAASAYKLAHFRELTQNAMAYGASRAREELTAAMQAGYLRPRESGMEPGGSPFAEGPEQWSKKTRDELKTRARRGETIRL